MIKRSKNPYSFTYRRMILISSVAITFGFGSSISFSRTGAIFMHYISSKCVLITKCGLQLRHLFRLRPPEIIKFKALAPKTKMKRSGPCYSIKLIQVWISMLRWTHLINPSVKYLSTKNGSNTVALSPNKCRRNQQNQCQSFMTSHLKISILWSTRYWT